MSGLDDDTYDISLYGLAFLSVSGFSALWCNIIRASGGLAPDPHRGSAPVPRWGTSVSQTLCQCPSQTKILDPLLVYRNGERRCNSLSFLPRHATAAQRGCIARLLLSCQMARHGTTSPCHLDRIVPLKWKDLACHICVACREENSFQFPVCLRRMKLKAKICDNADIFMTTSYEPCVAKTCLYTPVLQCNCSLCSEKNTENRRSLYVAASKEYLRRMQLSYAVKISILLVILSEIFIEIDLLFS